MTARVGLLVNPRAGRGHSARSVAGVVARLRAGGAVVEQVGGRSAVHAEANLRRACSRGLDSVVAMGGDGTVHLALQCVVGTRTVIGIVPTGTGNDFATTLGIPVDDPVAAAGLVVDGDVRRIDAGVVCTQDGRRRHFLCILSTGFDSAVNELANTMRWPSGRSRYVRATLAELRRFRAAEYTVTVDGAASTGLGMLVSVGNAQSYGGGMRLCPQARIDDGLLDVVWLHELGRWQFLRTFPLVFSGRHIEHPAVTQLRGQRIHLAAPGQVAYADGERIGTLPVEVSVAAGAVAVHAPWGT